MYKSTNNSHISKKVLEMSHLVNVILDKLTLTLLIANYPLIDGDKETVSSSHSSSAGPLIYSDDLEHLKYKYPHKTDSSENQNY